MKKLLVATTAAISMCPLHAVEVAQSADQVSIANDAFELAYNHHRCPMVAFLEKMKR